MAAITKVLGLVFCLCLFCEGIESYRCNPGVIISQSKQNATIKGQQVWNTTLENTCSCVQQDVKLSIANFDSVIKLNTTIISKSHDDIYDVNGGLPIYPQTGVFFTYAGEELNVTINDRIEACS